MPLPGPLPTSGYAGLRGKAFPILTGYIIVPEIVGKGKRDRVVVAITRGLDDAAKGTLYDHWRNRMPGKFDPNQQRAYKHKTTD